jgi:Zn-finger nucleic acid-binding protein
MGWFQDLRDRLAKNESVGMTKMDCPACPGTILRETRLGDFGSVILDICPRCSGVWLEKGELNRLDGSPWANVEEHRFHEVEGDHKSADCPNCAVALTPLSPADLPDVIVDRCPSCDGFWLDHGELDCMKEVAKNLDAEKGGAEGSTKPAGWSDLRWRIHQLRRTRD